LAGAKRNWKEGELSHDQFRTLRRRNERKNIREESARRLVPGSGTVRGVTLLKAGFEMKSEFEKLRANASEACLVSSRGKPVMRLGWKYIRIYSFSFN
jgi:polynucleotide 5'-kinase involved in rRNA processing